jgi:hypothetical protein
VCAGPGGTPLCRPRCHHGWVSQQRARAARVPGQEGGVVCGPRNFADVGDESPVRPDPQQLRAEAVRDAKLPSSRNLSIAQGRLRDYEARLGIEFAHTAYLKSWQRLRKRRQRAFVTERRRCRSRQRRSRSQHHRQPHKISHIPNRPTSRKFSSSYLSPRRPSRIR